jgi:MauM/NapG family ferredoxin protein
MKLKTFRRISQAVTFGLFLVLFFFTIYPYAETVPVEFFSQLDPLIAAVSMIAGRAFIATMVWAAVIIVATFIIGRFFCGYVCPLGTMIDLFDHILFRKKHKKESLEQKPNRNVKYFILIGVLAASLLGANLLHFFSPLAIAPRVMALVVFPPLMWLVNSGIDLVRPLLTFAGLDNLAQVSFKNLYFYGSIGTLVLFLFIIVSSYWRRRFWCRYICPTGAFLSIFSRFGIIKLKVDREKCNACNACINKCDMKAIDEKTHLPVLSECTLCGDCLPACKQDASSIGVTGFNLRGGDAALNVGRRQFMYSAGAGLATASVLKTGIHSKHNINGRYIRPPGSLPEKDFLARCVRCGECMKVCKTNGLQPSILEAGIDGFYTPHLVPRHGGCEEKCNMCGHVCPTEAIRPLPLEEKRFVKIGTAVIDRRRCIAWEQMKLCLICDEICPYDAIEFRIVKDDIGTLKRPFVLEDKCVGCGLCEQKCPVYGRGAIEVFSIGEERKKSGSYITEQKKKLREVKETHETDYGADALGSGGDSGSGLIKQESNHIPPATADDEPLPGGFLID